MPADGERSDHRGATVLHDPNGPCVSTVNEINGISWRGGFHRFLHRPRRGRPSRGPADRSKVMSPIGDQRRASTNLN